MFYIKLNKFKVLNKEVIGYTLDFSNKIQCMLLLNKKKF